MRGLRSRLREHGSSIAVATLTAAFATALVLAVAAAVAIAAATGLSEVGAVHTMLSVLAWLFLGIAVFVAGVVISNAFATIVAGRRREIALLRLIGSSAARQRRAVLGEGLAVGLLGAVLGYLIGAGVVSIVLRVAVASGGIADLAYPLFSPDLLLPLLVVVGTGTIAAWSGSRAVLEVTPVEAIGAAQPASFEALRSSAVRRAFALVLIVLGVLLLALGVVVGFASPAGVLIAFLGGVLSFTGIIVGAAVVLPPLMALLGRLLGRSAATRLAVANSRRYPERASRVMIALVIGVTLVVMFAVAAETFQATIREQVPLEFQLAMTQVLQMVMLVFGSLIGFSSVLAAIGTANTVALNLLQRTRELGLLRALGLSRRQLAAMIRAESALLALTGILFGVLLGVGYGWVGAQSFLSAGLDGAVVGLALPWPLLLGIAAAAIALIGVASALPVQRAIRLQPVRALAEA